MILGTVRNSHNNKIMVPILQIGRYKMLTDQLVPVKIKERVSHFFVDSRFSTDSDFLKLKTLSSKTSRFE